MGWSRRQFPAFVRGYPARQAPFRRVLSASLLAASLCLLCLAGGRAFAAARSSPSSPPSLARLGGGRREAGRVAAAAIAPAAASLDLPFFRRLSADVSAWVASPYRAYRLAKITREVVDDVMKRAKSSGKAKKSGGSGASDTLRSLVPTYMKSHVIARTSPEDYRTLLNTSINMFIEAITDEEPFDFQPYHKAIRGPGLDLYAWGNDFFRSMVKYRSSRVEGIEHVAEIKAKLAAGENVIFFANHQTEADPQVLSILLERNGHDDLAEKVVFVAGHKVTTDPMAIPFSKGRNLLTIFSKKYLENSKSEEEKEQKNTRNRATVVEMQRLLSGGGAVLWVAPSGGRDRRTSASGEFEPAKFDLQSVGLFQVLAKKAAQKAGPKTHFYPLAMWTNKLVPPPEDAKAGVGESRSAARAPIGVEFGAEMDLEELGGRKEFPEAAERIVRERYAHLDTLMRR